MQCPSCLSHNHAAATFCDQCGANLQGRADRGSGRTHGPSRNRGAGRRGVAVAGLLLVAVAVGLFLANDRSSPAPRRGGDGDTQSRKPVTAPGDVDERAAVVTADRRPQPAASRTAPKDPPSAAPNRTGQGPWTRAVVRIEDDWGNRFGEVPALRLAGGWLVLPRRACLGGTTWSPTVGGGTIERGSWRTGDEVGIWQLTGSEPGVPLVAWRGAQELTWSALDGSTRRERVRVRVSQSHGEFRRVDVFENLVAPGVFLEADAVVGFTFGEHGPPGGWLWQGNLLEHRVPDTDVTTFYRLTFAGGREEAFAKAIARSVSPYERVAAFAQGCRMRPRLTPEETPQSLRLADVILPIKSLLGHELEGANAAAFLALFDASVLIEAGDGELLVVLAASEHAHFGAAGALALLQGAGPAILRPGSPTESLATSLEQRIYDEWLQGLVNDRQSAHGWAVYRDAMARFPRDPLLHLRGAQLALVDADWREAERVLFAREYPVNLSDIVRVIQSEISRLKGQEGKIVIRFEPGANLIPTSALLNGRLEQRFMVDTGATRTTIPQAAADRLGLRTHGAPRVRVSTAGGIVQAATVTLDSMSLGGWEVPNVEVLVLDLPGTPDLGLIGLNFLNQFRMDLRIEEGTLVLEPR